MRMGRGAGWAWAAVAGLTGLLLAVARATGLGDVDPAGVLIGLGSLALSVWAGVMAHSALVWQSTDTAGLADRLARVVERQEATARHILLGRSVHTIDIAFTLHPGPAAAGPAPGAGATGTLSAITGYYRALRPGRLVITGAPGAGKTVLALELMLRLLGDRRPGEAVPVRLSLSGFDPTQPLETWLAERLVRDFGLKPRAAQELVADRKIIPFLDGLDEMDAEDAPHRSGPAARASAALDAMNGYLDGADLGQLVVTCRSGPHEALEAEERWLQDAARITIKAVTAETAWDFLEARTGGRGRWADVMEAIAQNPRGPLAQVLSTPWYLTVAATVYQPPHRGGLAGRSPSELLDPRLGTEAGIRDHLLGLLILAVTSAPVPGRPGLRRPAPYTTDRVTGWLRVLAAYLHANTVTDRRGGGRRLPSTDLVLHELWPLAGNRPRTLHTCLTLLALALLTVTLLSTGRVPLREGALIGVPFAAILGVAAAQAFWPSPSRLDRTWLRNPEKLLLLVEVAWLVAVSTSWAIATALYMSLAGIFFGVSVLQGLLWVVCLPMAVSTCVFAVGGLQILIESGVGVGSGVVSSVTPREVIRADLRAGALFWAVYGVVVLVTAMAAITYTAGSVTGGRAGAVAVFGVASAVWAVPVRYLAFLLTTRRRWAGGLWLPWRLGRFLDWCCQAGLMRTAGVAYQFRHRELQDFLIRAEAVPAPGSASPPSG